MGQQNGKEGDSSGGRFSISFSISMVLLGATHVFDDVGELLSFEAPPNAKTGAGADGAGESRLDGQTGSKETEWTGRGQGEER
jgi:hypothetical protein